MNFWLIGIALVLLVTWGADRLHRAWEDEKELRKSAERQLVELVESVQTLAKSQREYLQKDAERQRELRETHARLLEYEKSTDHRFVIGPHWLRIHDLQVSPSSAAAGGDLSGDSRTATDTEALGVISGNYDSCKQTRIQLALCQNYANQVSGRTH